MLERRQAEQTSCTTACAAPQQLPWQHLPRGEHTAQAHIFFKVAVSRRCNRDVDRAVWTQTDCTNVTEIEGVNVYNIINHEDMFILYPSPQTLFRHDTVRCTQLVTCLQASL